MLNDDSLQERLNAVKNGNDIPEPPVNPSDYAWGPKLPQDYTLTQEIILNSYEDLKKLGGILIASILYGFAFQAIFDMDWDILEVLGIGFIFNHAITVFPQYLIKLFKSSGV